MLTDAQAIHELLHTIVTTAEPIVTGKQCTEKQRQALLLAAEKLAIAARTPEENVYFIATQIAQNAAIRSAIAMGVFDAIPTDGSTVSAAMLSSTLKVDEDLLVRILRACASTHLFHEPSPSHYAHNALSLCYVKPENRDMTAQMYDFTCKGVFAIPEFGIKTAWQSHGGYEDGPFQLGARTHLGFWEYLKAVPARMQLFSAGMRSQVTVGNGRRSGAFPFGEVLGKDPCAEDDVVIVDVGGGRGQALEAIKGDYPELQGRMVLQDLADVIEDAKASGLSPFIEAQTGSFFGPQAIKGAHIYYFRRIFHDWDQVHSARILTLTRRAMAAHSRVVIADMVLPNMGAPRNMALQDLNMLSFGGMERTEEQWRQLMEMAGLVMKRIWRDEVGAKHAVIEAVLPEFEGA